ncbi:uncharacterized protein LOC129577232 isoform X2 [Sitodiplosis mosellana]|uniref:uncharacterized protein LOC129577232 isoform X2 n=1 Tax=Sitodiplosis mosellana TaxID=263140 RepID=UPI00244506C1|nr:uncharacterized protein LOC129577232 isoform X2 [Sitodiplosis mosellana]
MVSPSKPHHSRVASQGHLHKCKLVKGPKPLTHFKFYLDIEKHHIENKIEKSIRELGGSIEFFLAKKVTHFVTDKPIDRDGNLLSVSNHYLSPSSLLLSAQTKTPSPAQTKPASIQSLHDLNISDEKQAAAAAGSRPKSRADAMVQRARTTTQPLDSKSVQCASSQSLLQNPMQLALNWGTPIWNTDYTLKFLEKVSLALKLENPATRTTSSTKSSHHHHNHHHHHKTANVKHLNGEYIKIESTQKQYRPYYQEFSSWPSINFDCTLCPFQTRSDKTIPKTKNCDNPNANANVNPKHTNDDSLANVKIKAPSTINAKSITDVTVAGSVQISILAKNNITNIIESTMTRKTRNKQVREAAIDACSIKTNNDDVKPNSEKCGYCEKCRVEYDVLALHLQSKEHLNFVKNNDNYIALDSLINSGATNVENFLRINSGQMINETERNGMHSPRKDSLISTRVNYLSHTSFAEHKSDNNDTLAAAAKSHKQMNGIVQRSDELSPSKVNNVRERLPKYSPPITRRSQTKNAIQAIVDDQPITDTINAKVPPEKLNNSTTVDFRDDELNFISKADNDVQTKSPSKQGKVTTINGRKKCDEQQPTVVNHINDESPVLPKRLVRAFPRYKVIDGVPKATNERAAKHTKSNALNKSAELNAIEKELADDDEKGIKDPITGLIVKFKRVRESELSKLTFEADNFMFPKREELPTDEDRQSTSEVDGDASSEILSSDVSGLLRDTSLNNTSQNSSLNFSTASDQFTSSGRRKKRRTQFDNFKSPAQTKQKFRASLIQSRLNSAKTVTPTTPATTNGSQIPVKPLTGRGAKISAAKIAAAATAAVKGRRGRGRGKKQRMSTSTNVAIEAQADNSLDDRMGENTYIGGKLLATDYFQNLKFSFERVPSNEPWYLTFQRQDEHRERMFEYWGNTAYRKLPYELGPLPPLEPDCCLLSKLTAIKASKQQRNRRSTKSNVHVPVEVTNTKLTTTSEENAVSSSNSTTTTNTPSQKSNTISRACDESDNDRRPQTSTLSQLLLADSSLNSIALPSAISNKKKAVLLDAFGQPRKSPREHASTLAILSSLVQQRRKRIKEMNGGISPEKMPNYKAAVAAAIAAQHSADVSESEDVMDECESRLQIKATTETDVKPMSSRRRSNQTPVFEINKGTIVDANVQQSNGGYHSMEQSDKIFRLRKGKRRQTESVSSNNESISGKMDKTDNGTANDKDDKSKDHVDIPKMPVDEYVDPNKTARDLDDLLSNCYLDADSDLNHIPIDCSDLILVNTSKDFVEIIESVKDGPLTYRSLQRGKKRHINKTGWPSLPKKRLPKREKIDEKDDIDESAVSDVQNCESCHSDTENDLNDVPMDCENDNSNHVLEKTPKHDADDTVESSAKNSPIPFRSVTRRKRRNTNKTDDDNDEEKSRALRHDRRKIRTPFCDDNAVQFVVSASSSEKAENSDIFTVSSDSFLDTDVNNDTVTTAKSRLSADSRLSVDDEGSISDESTANNESNWHCRSSLRRSNSIVEEETKQQKGFPSVEESAASTTNKSAATTATTTTTTTSILERTLKSMHSTRSKFLRSPTLVKGTTIDLNLQPLVCVQKIADKDLPPQKLWINSLASSTVNTTTTTTTTTSDDSDVAKPNNRINSSPKTKTSPRKLRKPRGRWYRER